MSLADNHFKKEMNIIMSKLKDFWASLDEMTTISKRELFLGIAACTLAGIVTGVFFGPKKTAVIGSYNGNGEKSDKLKDKKENHS